MDTGNGPSEIQAAQETVWGDCLMGPLREDCPVMNYIRQLEGSQQELSQPLVDSCGAHTVVEGGWPEEWSALLESRVRSLLGDSVAEGPPGNQPVVRRKEMRAGSPRVAGVAEAEGFFLGSCSCSEIPLGGSSP